MPASQIKEVLLWCVAINYGVLIFWFALFVFAHDALYRLHSRWFKFPVETFDVINYAGMATYKIGVLLFNLVPLVALSLSS